MAFGLLTVCLRVVGPGGPRGREKRREREGGREAGVGVRGGKEGGRLAGRPGGPQGGREGGGLAAGACRGRRWGDMARGCRARPHGSLLQRIFGGRQRISPKEPAGHSGRLVGKAGGAGGTCCSVLVPCDRGLLWSPSMVSTNPSHSCDQA